jgi:hypothetical protein
MSNYLMKNRVQSPECFVEFGNHFNQWKEKAVIGSTALAQMERAVPARHHSLENLMHRSGRSPAFPYPARE